MSRVFVSARPRGKHDAWRRLGQHTRTKKYYWFSSDYAKQLRHRGQLAGSIPDTDTELKRVRKWAHKRGLVIKIDRSETPRQRLLRLIAAEVGVHEQPLGSNKGPRVDWYRKATTLWPSAQYGWPWCAAFVVRMALEAGYPIPRKMQTASVAVFIEEARKLGLTRKGPARAGDPLELLGPGVHIGFKVEGSGATIEGNTTPDGKSGSQYEGTSVARKHRSGELMRKAVNLDGLL